MKGSNVQHKITIFSILCCLLSSCAPVIYMPVEPAYDQAGKVRTDGHYVKDAYLAQLNADLKACAK